MREPGEWHSAPSIELCHGDASDVLRYLAHEEILVDAVVTDPPYGIKFMGREWDSPDNVAFQSDFWRLVLDVLKPGGHLLSFGGTRMYHRLAVAVEDAGFEIRDCVMWMYGTGFPKSHDVSKGIDKMRGAEREVVGKYVIPGYGKENVAQGAQNRAKFSFNKTSKEPVTSEAAEWEGWGTALKPAWEPVIVARKPLEGTVAENVLKYGTGAMNIDGCRIASESSLVRPPIQRDNNKVLGLGLGLGNQLEPSGRWPANAIHDGSDEVLEAFAEYGNKGGSFGGRGGDPDGKGIYGKGFPRGDKSAVGFGDKGSAARFFHDTSRGKRPGGFGNIGAEKGDPVPNGPTYGDNGSPSRFYYSAKTSTKERDGSKHPTIKPVALMRYLVRLVTPPGGLVLDPFAGTGTTGVAAREEGCCALLVEREAEHVRDALRKIGAKRKRLALAG